VQKMTTIGSLGSAPHTREMYSYPRNACLLFFILPDPYSPNGNSHLDHNASIDADSLKQVLFGSFEICKENFKGHISLQKLKHFLDSCKSMNFLNNFGMVQDTWKIQAM
jgi:hypothetical protein